jgi:hypothetical protein
MSVQDRVPCVKPREHLGDMANRVLIDNGIEG